ncbi:MAG: tetratricopeptide repeat protein [Candidatus Rifleibacteriota bacterium]
MLQAPKNLHAFLLNLEKQAEENPDDLKLLLRLARLYQKNGATDDAIKTYRRILNREPENALYMAELAACHIKKNKFSEAEFLLERAQEVKPGYYAIFLTFAALYEARGITDKQVGFMMRAANAAPEKFSIRLALADLLKRYGDGSGACNQYQLILETNPDLEAALFGLGTLLMKRNELNEAMVLFRKIIQNNPGAFDAHFNLASCLFRQNKFTMAINYFQMSCRSKKLFEKSLYLSAQCYFKLNDFDRAIVTMERLVLLKENDISYNKSLAEIYKAAGEYDLARDSYKFLSKIAPQRPEFMVNYAEMLVTLKDFSRATKALDGLFRAHPGHLEGHRLLGEIYLNNHQFKAAIEEFKRTLMINENHVKAYLGLEKVYEKTSDLQNQYEALKKAIELGTESQELLLKLGQLENKLKLPTSLDRFRKVTQLDPNSDYALEAEYYLKHQAA